MSDGSTARSPAEASVRDQRNRGTESHTGNRRGRVEHFSHARATLGSFVADHHDVSLTDLSAEYRGDGVVLGIKDPGRTFVHKHLGRNRALLDNSAFRRDVSRKDSQPARFAVRIVHRTDNFGIPVECIFNIFTDRLSGHGHAVEVQKPEFGQLVHDSINPARLVQLIHIGMACRGEVAQVRCLCGIFICQAHVQFKTDLMGDGRKVQHRIGGAAESHVHRQRIADGFLSDDVAGTDILPVHLHNLVSRMLGQADSRRINRRDRSVTAEAHTDGLCQAVHAVGCIHAGAGAAGRAAVLLEFIQLLLGHRAGLSRTHCLKDAGQGCMLPGDMSRKHRAAAHEDRRYIKTSRGHEQAGNIFVTVRDADHRVELVGHNEGFRGIRDQISRDEGILHAGMTHCNAVAYSDRGNQHRESAGLGYAQLDCFGDLVEVHMPGNDFIVGTDHCNERLFHLFLRHAERIPQRSVRGLLKALLHCITSHYIPLLPENTFQMPKRYQICRFRKGDGPPAISSVRRNHFFSSVSALFFFPKPKLPRPPSNDFFSSCTGAVSE